jgi:adenylate cyclase
LQIEATVMFADVRGFTALSEQLGAGKTFALLNDLYGCLGPVIRSHGGFIDKYIGDALLATFPVHTADALDAVLSMHEAIERLNQSRARANGARLQVGVGVLTGQVMMGAVGEMQRMEVTVISDAVNVASRLEGISKAMGAFALTTSDTYALATKGERGQSLRTRPLGLVLVEGKVCVVSVAIDFFFFCQQCFTAPLRAVFVERAIVGCRNIDA